MTPQVQLILRHDFNFDTKSTGSESYKGKESGMGEDV